MTDIDDIIERSVLIRASIEQVWQLVSQPGWWINDGSHLALDTIKRISDDRAVVTHPDAGEIAVETVSSDPPRIIVYRWGVSGAADHSLTARDVVLLRTTVTFTLAAEGEATRLSVVESGFATADVDGTARANAFGANSEGWDVEMGLAVASLSE